MASLANFACKIMIPSVYINLEDDVAKVVARIKKEKSEELVLVCPKRCQLFSDSINLRLLKKQAELLKKQIFILTMDERGQVFAKEAGFALKFLPKTKPKAGVSDISLLIKPAQPHEEPAGGLVGKVKSVTSFVSSLVSKKSKEETPELISQNSFADPEIFRPAKGAKSASSLKPKLTVDRRSFPEQAEANLAAEKFDKKGKKRHSFVLSFSLALSLIVILSLVFVVLPQAVVVIYPKSEPVTRDFDVSLDPQTPAIDVSSLILPAVKVEEIIDLESKFKSQGKKDVGNKAVGNIRIYNFTGQILNLRAQTTSLTAGSKTYHLSEDALQIKPTKYKNAQTKEVDEGSLIEPLEIAAAAGGEDSNLPAGIRLEITNQVFGSRPQIVYAKSETPISGGTTRFLSIVSESDIQTAQSELNKKSMERIRSQLAAKGLQLVENAFRAELQEFTADKQVGAESPSFEAKLKIKIIGLAFSEPQLKELVTRRITQTFSQNRQLKTEKDFSLLYKIRNADLNSFSGSLNVHFEGRSIMKVDLSGLSAQLIGKSKEQASEILLTIAEIEKTEATLSPSWQKTFPWFESKIQIRLLE